MSHQKMLNNNFYLVITVIMFIISGCATTQRDWQETNKKGTISSYEGFIDRHPETREAEQAKKQIDELRADQDWKAANFPRTINGFEEFIDRHPKTRKAEQAKKEIEELRAHQDWKAANFTHTINAYQDFLVNHPNYMYAPEAKKQLKQLEAVVEPRRKITKAEIIQVSKKIEAEITPFTLDKYRNLKTSPEYHISPDGVSYSYQSSVKGREEGGKHVSVLCAVLGDGDFCLQSVEFEVFEGDFDLQQIWLKNRRRGKIIIKLAMPSGDPSDPIGFEAVSLEGNGFTMYYRRNADGNWTVEKYKTAMLNE